MKTSMLILGLILQSCDSSATPASEQTVKALNTEAPAAGEKGETGAQGIQGVPGTNGTNGTNGAAAPTIGLRDSLGGNLPGVLVGRNTLVQTDEGTTATYKCRSNGLCGVEQSDIFYTGSNCTGFATVPFDVQGTVFANPYGGGMWQSGTNAAGPGTLASYRSIATGACVNGVATSSFPTVNSSVTFAAVPYAGTFPALAPGPYRVVAK